MQLFNPFRISRGLFRLSVFLLLLFFPFNLLCTIFSFYSHLRISVPGDCDFLVY